MAQTSTLVYQSDAQVLQTASNKIKDFKIKLNIWIVHIIHPTDFTQNY